ncbi:hypothetical protein R6Q57_014344 [Mikania cordata]
MIEGFGDQQNRASVSDLANKFENGLAAAAAKLVAEDKLQDVASLEKHVLLENIRAALESLRVRAVGKNKDAVEEAIAMASWISLTLTLRESEFVQQMAKIKKLASFLKQASEDAKKLVDEERAFARSEIEKARTAVRRVEEALQEQERTSGKQDVEELMKEVKEARRIKMLHQPSKVMFMDHELQALRGQLIEKSKYSLKLQKELEMSKQGEKDTPDLFEFDGTEALGSYLVIHPCFDNAPELKDCSIQWYRLTSEDGKKHLISGATKPIYAPEPFDVGRVLQADIVSDGVSVMLTSGPIDPVSVLWNCLIEL